MKLTMFFYYHFMTLHTVVAVIMW